MSGPSTYVPQTGFTRWLDSRLPLMRFTHDTILTFPTPRNLNFWYAFGAILTFFLGVQISENSPINHGCEYSRLKRLLSSNITVV